MTMKVGTSFTEATRPTVDGNLLALFIGTARSTNQEQGNMQSLVFNDTLPKAMGTTHNSPKLGSFTAQGLTDGEDVSNFQTLTSSNVVTTPGEVGVAFKFTKRSLAQWTEPMQVRAGRIAKDALARKKDADLIGLASSFTTYAALGAAATVMTNGHIIAAVSTLRGGNNTAGSAISAGAVTNQVPPGPINVVARWESLTQPMRQLAGAPVSGTVGTTQVPASYPGGSPAQEVFNSLFVSNAWGASIYGNSNIAKDSDDDMHGLAFHKDAIIYVGFPHEGATGEAFVRDSNDGRSIQVTLVDDYGFGVLDQNYAIDLLFDATRATS